MHQQQEKEDGVQGHTGLRVQGCSSSSSMRRKRRVGSRDPPKVVAAAAASRGEWDGLGMYREQQRQGSRDVVAAIRGE
jgi:hypothetical protein